MRFLKAMQTSDRGNLQIQITSSVDSFPVPDASIRISYARSLENNRSEYTIPQMVITLPISCNIKESFITPIIMPIM